MKKSSKLTRTMRMNGCMFMDSNESNSGDDDECRLPTAELVFSDHDQGKCGEQIHTSDEIRETSTYSSRRNSSLYWNGSSISTSN